MGRPGNTRTKWPSFVGGMQNAMAMLFFQSYGPEPDHLPRTIHSSPLVVFCTNSRTYSWI